MMKRRNLAEIYRTVDGVVQRKCIDCPSWLPATLEHFYRCDVAKDGLQVRCKTCHNKRTGMRQKELRARRSAINRAAA